MGNKLYSVKHPNGCLTWTNPNGIIVMKMCCSCKYCFGNETIVDTEGNKIRGCKSHKDVDGRYQQFKWTRQRNIGCRDWTPKKGLVQVGTHLADEIRILDVDAHMRAYEEKVSKSKNLVRYEQI